MLRATTDFSDKKLAAKWLEYYQELK
jgi:hypothetical protein